MTAQELIAALDAGPMERLRFVVLREFGVLPCSRAARIVSIIVASFSASSVLKVASFSSPRFSVLNNAP